MTRTPLQLDVAPADDLIDVPRRIRVTGAAPGQDVEIVATTERAGAPWRSRIVYRAGADGSVDLTRDAPLEGDYPGVSPMGLIWSQRPLEAGRRDVFNAPGEPLLTRLVARTSDGQATGDFVQRLAGPGVTRREVREAGLVGALYLPPGDGPHPAVMILNGSGGGINEPRAALYASRGYAAFALAYFKAPGLSDYISNTPLEYFQAGLDWLRRTVRPLHDFVAVSGQSRGGELVLLLGATFPEAVSAVVAYVPGAVVHSGQNASDPKVGREGPTWLLGGKPLPHLWENNRTATWAPFDEGPPPHRHERAILTALQDAEAVARARIPVERIRGPVMLLSGTDDGSWPSSRYSRMVRDALADAGHPYPVRWLDFEGAGHAILFPYVPTTQLVYAHPVSGRVSTGGGNPVDNARADQQSWDGVLRFLADAVRARAASKETSMPEQSTHPSTAGVSPLPDAASASGSPGGAQGVSPSAPASAPGDVIDRIVGLAPGSATHATRHRRDKVVAATQGSYDALFATDLPDLPLAERLLVALYACRLTPAPELAAHYRGRLAEAGADAAAIAVAESGQPADARDPRLAAILAFTRTLIENPVEGDRAALNTLPTAGLSTPAIVALSQLIAFLSYQVRLVAGLKAMKALEDAQ